MKFKTTKKEIMDGYDKVISIGYCNAQFLLHCESPVAYTCGKDGWHADIYEIDDVAIVTGYSPFGNTKPSYELIRQLDKEAEIVCGDWSLDWDSKKNKLTEMIKFFIIKALEQSNFKQ